MFSKIKTIFLIFAFFIIISSLVKTVLVYTDRFKVYSKLKKIRENLKKKNIELSTKERFIQTSFYIEKIARDQLQMGREGETVVILPSPVNKKNTGIEEPTPIWRQWVEFVAK